MSAEAALLRTLRDINDGHLNLWVGALFDPMTGDCVAPELLHTTPDRAPTVGVPNRDGAWWLALYRRGWLAAPEHDGDWRHVWSVTDTGKAALAEALQAVED